MGKPQIIICGSIAIDRIMNFSGRYRDLIQPDKIHVISISPLLDKLEDTPGGIGANIASSLALLGEQPVLLGSVGRGAENYLSTLQDRGVDVSSVHISDKATASFNVITDSEDNQVGGFYPGAMLDSESLSLQAWQGQDTLVIVAPHDPMGMNRQVKECADYGLRLAYDPGQQVADDKTDLAAGVAAAEVVFVNDYEQGLLCKRLGINGDELAAKVPVLITTLGKEGSLISGTRVPEPVPVSIAQPDTLADPTGAGDAYRAGFLYGYARQWELRKCGQLGAVIASLIIEQHGTQREFTKAEVTERYKANFNEEIEL